VRSRLVSVPLALAILCSVHGQSFSASVADVVGFAATTCQKFKEEFRIAPETTNAKFHDWLAGFWSGLNMERKISKTTGPELRGYGDLKSTLAEELLIECQMKPESPLIASIFSLIYQRK
jgi:hypothetical protein